MGVLGAGGAAGEKREGRRGTVSPLPPLVGCEGEKKKQSGLNIRREMKKGGAT